MILELGPDLDGILTGQTSAAQGSDLQVILELGPDLVGTLTGRTQSAQPLDLQ